MCRVSRSCCDRDKDLVAFSGSEGLRPLALPSFPFLPLSLFPSSRAVEGSLRRSGTVEQPGAQSEVCCWFGWCVLEDFSQSGALVVLVEVLPGPACVASAVLLAAVFSLMSAWALSVKVSCPWLCVWLLHWPACLGLVCPRGLNGLLCSCARHALADGGLVSVVVLGWLCFVWKCQSCVVVLPLACGRDLCVSPSSAFRQLLGVVVLHYGVVLSGCALLQPSGGVIFP
ncbi:hypothetical protein Taro_049154 [Colocasia esculenta]|uniref:Uncharacterized protein n=1 Tax=Colocasia esculenta TaxID=4460 RepID=A0A843XA83_COLES|nr:hypothetical protein [Colocasia esculenta]